MMLSRHVENFPGADNATGAALMGRMVTQAASFGTMFSSSSAVAIKRGPASRPTGGSFLTALKDGRTVQSRAVIVATGAVPR